MSYIVSQDNGKTHVALTDDDMARMHAVTAPADGSTDYYTAFMLELWYVVVGGKVVFEGMESINPTMWAIPKEQWLKLAGWLVEHTPENGRTGNSMDFVNHAPSAY